MAQRQDEFKKLGIKLVAVSYDEVKILKEFSDKGTGKSKVDYPLLADTESELIRAFGIFNERIQKEHEWYGVPLPHVYIVNQEGRIEGKFSRRRYQERPSPDNILAFIKKNLNKPEQVSPKDASDE